MEAVPVFEVERRNPPGPQVNCGDCMHAIPAKYYEFIHCCQGSESVIRGRNACRSCAHFVEFEAPAAAPVAAARSVARTAATGDGRAAFADGKTDQRRCSTADQSQIRDFALKPAAADQRQFEDADFEPSGA